LSTTEPESADVWSAPFEHAAPYFLRVLGREAPLLLLVTVLLAILAGFGSSFGLPDLFWSATAEDPGSSAEGGKLVTGLAVGIFLCAAVLVGLLVETTEGEWTAESFRERLVYGCWALGVVFVCIWIRGSVAQTSMTLRPLGDRGGWTFPVAVLMGLGLLYVVIRTLTSLRIFEGILEWLGRYFPGLPRDSPLAKFHEAAAVLVAGALLLYLLVVFFLSRSVYPGFAICIVLTFLAGVHGFVAYRLGIAHTVFYAIVVVVFALLNANWQRARVPELDAAVGRSGGPSPLIPNERALAAWSARSPEGGHLPGLVVVATSGGGIRAGLWTGVVLTALEERWADFPTRLRLITGASGGMLGATEWTTTIRSGSPSHTPEERQALVKALEWGGLKAVTSGLVLRDLLPPPLRYGDDRGRRLEEAWESYCPGLAQPVSSLALGEAEGWRPSLVLAPAIVEDGRFLVVSNLDLQGMLESAGPRVSASPDSYGLRGFQLLGYLPEASSRLRLSTAVRLQANFPYVLPSTEVPGPSGGYVRVVDAGYRDDLGVELATAWIAWNRTWLEKNTSGVLLIQVRDSNTSRLEPPSGSRGFLARGFDGVLTPASGLASSWWNTPPSRNDEAVEELAHALNRDAPFFTTAIFELDAPAAPLTWSLTPAESRGIRESIRGNRSKEEIRAIAAWGAAH
jgi:hypothetical protein